MSSAAAVIPTRDTLDHLLSLMDGLDAAMANDDVTSRKLFRFRRRGMLFIKSGMNRIVSHTVPTRMLCDERIWFLFAGFLHNQTECMIRVPSNNGSTANLAGVVTSCKFLEGKLHSIEVRFSSPIDPAEYCAEAFSPRVLIIGVDQAFTTAVQRQLSKYQARVDAVENGSRGVEAARTALYDVVFVDLATHGPNQVNAVRELRKQGYQGAIVGITRPLSPGAESVNSDGCDELTHAQFAQSDMSVLLKRHVGDPLYSDYEYDVKLRELIHEFLSELPVRLRGIEEPLKKKDTEGLVRGLRAVKAVAGSFGFTEMSEQARTLEEAIAGGATLESLEVRIIEFVRNCTRARSSPIPTGKQSAASSLS